MNLILLFPEDFILGTNRVRLTGRRQKHVLEIHRAQKGDELCVGLRDDQIGWGIVTELDETALEMDVRWAAKPPTPLPVTLILALPRPPMLRRALFTAASMGVKKIYLINSYRVEKTYWQSHALRESDIQEQLVLGLEQARDTMMPEVHLCPRFKPFVEDELPGVIKNTIPLLAHPEAQELCPANVPQPVTLAVGPEGGFIPFEVEKFFCLGFRPVHLGERILRVETAVPALLGRFA